jgi:hypothetical protein
MTCTLCKTRPPRRQCPAFKSEICARCCGEEREQTIDCPFDCEHLLVAREREEIFELPEVLPNSEIRTDEGVIRNIEPLIMMMIGALFLAAGKNNATDFDVREAVAAMIRERLGEEVGPLGDVAQAVKVEFDAHWARFQAMVIESGEPPTRRIDVAALVFIQREEMIYNNRRVRSRAYIDHMRSWVSEMAAAVKNDDVREDGN